MLSIHAKEKIENNYLESFKVERGDRFGKKLHVKEKKYPR